MTGARLTLSLTCVLYVWAAYAAWTRAAHIFTASSVAAIGDHLIVAAVAGWLARKATR